MKLVILFGPPAVGKMTVGHELEKLTGLKLFHNHMTIDLVRTFFDYGTPSFEKLVSKIRKMTLEEVAQSKLPGAIFTYVWAFDEPSDAKFIQSCATIFKKNKGTVYYVELQAAKEERLKRNKSEWRLQHKPDKRDIARSEANLHHTDEKYSLQSPPSYFKGKKYLYIDTTNLTAEETAYQICTKFHFQML